MSTLVFSGFPAICFIDPPFWIRLTYKETAPKLKNYVILLMFIINIIPP